MSQALRQPGACLLQLHCQADPWGALPRSAGASCAMLLVDTMGRQDAHDPGQPCTAGWPWSWWAWPTQLSQRGAHDQRHVPLHPGLLCQLRGHLLGAPQRAVQHVREGACGGPLHSRHVCSRWVISCAIPRESWTSAEWLPCPSAGHASYRPRCVKNVLLPRSWRHAS